jgi:rare lipoprotein A
LYVALHKSQQPEGANPMKKLFAAFLCLFVFFEQPALAKIGTTTGWCSFYKSGKRTANGEHFNPMGLTAAHRKLPFGTRVKVTNLRNGKSVIVRINDRGPFIKGRVMDLSLGAARVIGLNKSGVAKISFVIL